MKNSAVHIIFLLALAWGSLPAQYMLSLELRDRETNDAVKAYELFVMDPPRSIRHDASAPLEVSFEKAGTYKLVLFSFEYNTLYHDIDIQSDTAIQLYLEPLSETVNEVMITARRKELFALRNLDPVVGTSIFSSKKTERVFVEDMLANKASNNARQVYARVAGLNIYDASEGGLQLNIGARGLNPNRSANFNIRQNGYDISADVLGYPESYYTPPAEALQEIQIVRGAASLQYGTQFGGLVNFKLKTAPRYDGTAIESRQSIGSFGLFNSFNSLGMRSGKWGIYGYYNYKRGDGYRPFSSYNSHNAYGILEYALGPGSTLSVEHSYFHYLARQAGGLTDPLFEEDPRQALRERNWFLVDWHLSALKFTHRFGEKSVLSINSSILNASRQAVGFRGSPARLNSNPVTELDEQRPDGSYLNPRDVILGDFNNLAVEGRMLNKFDLPFFKGEKPGHFLFGFKYYRANNAAIQGPGSLMSDADFTLRTEQFPDYPSQSSFEFPNENLALFTEALLEISDRFSITPGARLEFIKTTSEGVYNRVVFDNAGNPLSNEQRSDNRTLDRRFVILGIGSSFKPGVNTELYANLTENYRSVTFSDIRVVNPSFIVDPDIRDESGYSMDLGFRGRSGKSFSFDIGSFLIYYNDRIGIIFDDRANRVRKNIGTARIFGIESLLQWNVLKSFDKDITDYQLDLFSNFAWSHSEYTDSEENNVVGKQVEFVPRFNIKAGLNFGFKNALFSILWSYLSEQYTDVENSAVASAGDVRNGLIGPIPSYQLVDLSSKWRIHENLHLEAGINNVLNTDYFTQRATGYPGPGIIPSYGRNLYLTIAYQLD